VEEVLLSDEAEEELEHVSSRPPAEPARRSMSTSGTDAMPSANCCAAPGANSVTVSWKTSPHPFSDKGQ
jgi:hypothetical protein